MRSVKRIMYAEPVDMGGTPVLQALPTVQIGQIDPFLLLHHLRYTFEGNSIPQREGVGPHPHRGFSPVSFIFKGSVHHRDSRGNDNIIHAGGVQWLDAGMGIIHSERPSKDVAENGGEQEAIQLWINTPKAFKMNQPLYQPFQSEELPSITPQVGTGQLSLVAGEYDGQRGPAKTNSELLVIMGRLDSGAKSSFTVSTELNTLLYLVSGELRLEGHGKLEELNMVHFDYDDDLISIEATTDAQFLLLAGRPIKEPLAQQGPFVMNNETEILEAMRDYQMGKMGVLIEEFD